MSVEDYLVDKNSIKGMVAVKGSISCLSSEFCSIHGDNVMVSAMFDPERLPREDRKQFLSCNPFSAPCIATIIGMNQPANSFKGIAATQVIWEPSEEDIAAADPSRPPCNSVPERQIREIVENSPLAKMTRMSVIKVTINTWNDKSGHLHCTARVMTNGGERKLRFYIKPDGDRYVITGSWQP